MYLLPTLTGLSLRASYISVGYFPENKTPPVYGIVGRAQPAQSSECNRNGSRLDDGPHHRLKSLGASLPNSDLPMAR